MPINTEVLIDALDDIRRDLSRLQDSIDRIIRTFECESNVDQQKRKAIQNREDAIDELLKREGLYW